MGAQVVHKEGDGMLSHIVTGDETSFSHITPESKQQSLHWKYTGPPKREKLKQTISTWKIMCTVFWERQGVSVGRIFAPGHNSRLCCLL
jgi:hypothetical protein